MEAATKIPEEVEALAAEIVDTARANVERAVVIRLVAESLQPLHEHMEELKSEIVKRVGDAIVERLGASIKIESLQGQVDFFRSELAKRDEKIDEIVTQLDTLRARGFV